MNVASRKAREADRERFGLWLDKRIPGCDPRFDGKDPFAHETKHPGVKYLHRGEQMPAGSFYGYPTGIVGLRLFPNTNFDGKAKAKWDPEKYYANDPSYVTKDLVRPYRVGMSCGFCHVGPNPLKPPADPNNPKWENLSSNVGARYFWFDRIFAWQADEASLLYQVLHTYRPGALDTSARIHGLHRQSSHDECGLLFSAATGVGQALGTRNAGRRWTEQQAIQRFLFQRPIDGLL